jgi:hypothetical protein
MSAVSALTPTTQETHKSIRNFDNIPSSLCHRAIPKTHLLEATQSPKNNICCTHFLHNYFVLIFFFEKKNV